MSAVPDRPPTAICKVCRKHFHELGRGLQWYANAFGRATCPECRRTEEKAGKRRQKTPMERLKANLKTLSALITVFFSAFTMLPMWLGTLFIGDKLFHSVGVKVMWALVGFLIAIGTLCAWLQFLGTAMENWFGEGRD